MAKNLKGTNITSPVVPFTDADTFPTHIAEYGKGGYRSALNLEELSNIPEARREEGMKVWVINDPSGIHEYQLVDGKWARSRTATGIPIYDQDTLSRYGITPESPDSYISIPNKNSDLGTGEIDHNTYETSGNGNYVDVIFSALRALQTEVAKIKNSFEYGLESYTGTATAMSTILGSYATEEEIDNKAVENLQEPIWEVTEDGLSSLDDIDFSDEKSTSEFSGDCSYLTNTTAGVTYMKINSPGVVYKPKSEVLNAIDSKLYFFIVSKGLDFTISLTKDKDSKLYSRSTGKECAPYSTDNTLDADKNKITSSEIDLNLKTIMSNTKGRSENDLYSILVIISRKQKIESDYYGENFIWINVSDFNTNQTLYEGYYNDGPLVNSVIRTSYIYDISGATFNSGTYYKFKIYSKWQDYSHNVIPTKINDSNYKFKAAHITIRGVDDMKTLNALQYQLLPDELVWVEDTQKLWIKSKKSGELIPIGGNNKDNKDKDKDNNMTSAELASLLKELGIVVNDNDEVSLKLAPIEDITFINNSTNSKYKFTVNSEGSLISQKIPETSDTYPGKLKGNDESAGYSDNKECIRGFVAQINKYENKLVDGNDFRLYSDRLKIGAFYAPLASDIAHGCSHSYIELENTSYKDIPLTGCYLFLTRPDLVSNNAQSLYKLALTGTIPAGGTYLIRGAKHAEFNDPNCYLKVKTYDQEWYYDTDSTGTNKKLVSLEINDSSNTYGYGLALTYGDKDKDGKDITPTTILCTPNNIGDTVAGVTISKSTDLDKYPNKYDRCLIDSIYFYKSVLSGTQGCWALNSPVGITSNTIYRNTFELDPAKQAFQALCKNDSSRTRWSNAVNDYQVLNLDNEYISFPHSEDTYPISKVTPKASWENKNVCTDKSKLDIDKPNMVTTSFGINIYKTRCFNWISVGYFPEYVWIKKSSDPTYNFRAQSYIPIREIKIKSSNVTNTITFTSPSIANPSATDLSGYNYLYSDDGKTKIVDKGISIQSSAKEFTMILTGAHDYSGDIKNGSNYKLSKNASTPTDTDTIPITVTSSIASTKISFADVTSGWTSNISLDNYVELLDPSHKLIATGSAPSYSDQDGVYYMNFSGGISVSLNTDYFLSTKKDETASADGVYPRKKFFSADVTNNIYSRLTGRFPADNSFYTSHKVIVDIVSESAKAPVQYDYVVGRAGKDGGPDPEHTSEVMHFTLYPESYVPRIYQTTDQQGFHWIEYQVWAAVADKLNETITSDCAKENIIPILVNTGDMTQNGTRVNEWYDYYQAGRHLFNHLEQMCVVGNNDLVNSTDQVNPDGTTTKCYEILGTGDDEGKSNSYFFHLMYCYEVGDAFTPLVKNVASNGTTPPKYIPSLYYFDTTKYRFLMVNSEITETNCKSWYGLSETSSGVDTTYNIYTGFKILGNRDSASYIADTAGFTPIYNMIYNTLKQTVSMDDSGKITAHTKNVIAFCHEMPFTVITNESLDKKYLANTRSVKKANTSLIGSHLNQISITETNDPRGNHGIYWFSRLLEYFGVRLMLGGHKHTYVCTYPVREFYLYDYDTSSKSYQKNSWKDGPMVMPKTLKDENISFKGTTTMKNPAGADIQVAQDGIDLTKFPLTKRASSWTGKVGEAMISSSASVFYPSIPVSDLTGGVVYFMCQASGYKLTSNKELPSADQKFGHLIPKTSISNGTDKPNINQKYPMISIVDLSDIDNYKVSLIRVTGIMDSGKFTQTTYSKDNVGYEYASFVDTNDYGSWGKDKTVLVNC